MQSIDVKSQPSIKALSNANLKLPYTNHIPFKVPLQHLTWSYFTVSSNTKNLQLMNQSTSKPNLELHITVMKLKKENKSTVIVDKQNTARDLHAFKF
jgi:hypothetical protein